MRDLHFFCISGFVMLALSFVPGSEWCLDLVLGEARSRRNSIVTLLSGVLYELLSWSEM